MLMSPAASQVKPDGQSAGVVQTSVQNVRPSSSAHRRDGQSSELSHVSPTPFAASQMPQPATVVEGWQMPVEQASGLFGMQGSLQVCSMQ